MKIPTPHPPCHDKLYSQFTQKKNPKKTIKKVYYWSESYGPTIKVDALTANLVRRFQQSDAYSRDWLLGKPVGGVR